MKPRLRRACVASKPFVVNARWKPFAAGARIVLISDSCHSGTIARKILFSSTENGAALARGVKASFRPRNLPDEALKFIRTHWLEDYRARQSGKRDVAPDELAASLIQISGCQDNQTSSDSKTNGVFTSALIDVWAKGNFTGSYVSFHEAIRRNIPNEQNPNYWALGAPNTTFESQKPFTIDQHDTQPAEGDAHMATLHPGVEQLMRGRNGSGGRSLDDVDVESVRDVAGSCTITISRDAIIGKSDREILNYFSQIVAPETCSNYFIAREGFSGKSPRGGEISCKVDSKGNAGCEGTWHF